MTRCSVFLLVLVSFLLGGLAGGQTPTSPSCVNHISVDGKWLEGPGFAGQAACYFLNHGNGSDAFTPAQLLADAMGLELSWDGASKTLTFTQGDTVARLRATSDVAAGLQDRSDVFTVNGAPFSRPIPAAIIIEGTSWVPVGSITDAFGARAPFDPQSKVIFIETAAYQARVAAARAEAEARAAAAALLESGPEPKDLRVAYHRESEQTYTRIVIEIPAGTDYSLAVGGSMLALRLPGLSADPFTLEADGNPHLRDLWYGVVDGALALVIETQFEVLASGQGYRMGFLPPTGSESYGRLYLDLGPGLSDEPSTALATRPQALPARSGVGGAQPQQVDLKLTVVLDPGHGGKFAGARGLGGSVKEEELVLEVAYKVKALLEAHGIKVVMTRTGNTHLSEDYDRDLVSRANFATIERNLFVSIHANGFTDPDAHGIETYIFGQPLNEAALQAAIRENGGGAVGAAVTNNALAYAAGIDGDLMAQQILQFSQMLAHSVQDNLIAETGATDRGVKQAPYRVLTQSRIPAILIELGFVNNPTEGRRLTTDAYQDKLAKGIAAGILSFVESNGSVATR